MTTKNLGDVLLLIPCCSNKDGNGLPPRVRSAPLDTELSEEAFDLLREGRRLVAEKYSERFELASPLYPAAVWYTGNPYKLPGFRESLDSAFERGMRCLIVSAGYGLLRPDDTIHKYNVKMSETLTVWGSRLPQVLADYISRNGIKRVFGAMSKKYYEAVADVRSRLSDVEFHWCVPHHPRGAPGSAMQEVPKAAGLAVIDLIASDFKPDSRWSKTPVWSGPASSQ
jgi:hypothetical protein